MLDSKTLRARFFFCYLTGPTNARLRLLLKKWRDRITFSVLAPMNCNVQTVLGTLLLTVLAVGQTADKATTEKTTKDYVDLLRKDIRREKSSVVDLAMALDAAQKSKFYPIYEKYEKELTSLWDKRLTIIKTYAASYPDVSDAVADQLVGSSYALQVERTALWKKYYGQVKSALGPKVAARFLQVENALSNLIDLQLSSEIPLMP
jgi:hypothetical protein